MSIRFLHTSDWQVGMTRAFLSADAQARYADDQIEAVRHPTSAAGGHGMSEKRQEMGKLVQGVPGV